MTLVLTSLCLAAGLLTAPPAIVAQAPEASPQPTRTTVEGRQLVPAELGPTWIESWSEAARRTPLAPDGQQSAGALRAQVPQVPLAKTAPQGPLAGTSSSPAPIVQFDFEGPTMGDFGSSTSPPDPSAAVGKTQVVTAMNKQIVVYDKQSGAQLAGMNLANFFPGANGDFEVVYDHFADRWILIASNYAILGTGRIFVAVSSTSDATGSFLKTSITMPACVPQWLSLGYDKRGIYIGAQLFHCGSARVFALDKSPLVASSQSVGTVTVFGPGGLGGDWFQTCVTYGDPGVTYAVSLLTGSALLRLFEIAPPLTQPTLTVIADLAVPTEPGSFQFAPALGAPAGLVVSDSRLRNAVYRDGTLYLARGTVAANPGVAGMRHASRWYEIEASTGILNDTGLILDDSLGYFVPSIAVNKNGDVALGFGAADAATSPGGYVATKLGSQTSGFSDPVLFKPGSGDSYELLDNLNLNRWGQTSATFVDPSDDLTFWTLQTYVKGIDTWGTWIAKFIAEPHPITYCTPKLSSAFCINLISSSSPCLAPTSGGQDYSITCNDVQGLKNGLLFAGISGSSGTPFNNGFLCVNPPLKRGPLLNSGGSSTTSCDGSFSTLVNDGLIVPFGLDPGPGQKAWYQYWYRDPQNGAGANGTALSDALEVPFL